MATVPSTNEDRSESNIRVLVVEDSEIFRPFLCSILEQHPCLEIVGEASDGLEAVQSVRRLRPALILLDIGLPSLNGLEVARKVRKISPETKIIFVTQEASGEMAQEAFNIGALGYVVKLNTGRELLTALELVRQGKRFVGSGIQQLM